MINKLEIGRERINDEREGTQESGKQKKENH